MSRFLFRLVVPSAAGLAWTHATWVVLQRLYEVLPKAGGVKTLGSMFFNPVMFVWETGGLPAGGSGLVALYVYYAILAVFVWNGREGGRGFRAAAVAYGLHVAANMVTCFLYVFTDGPPIPGLARYYLWNDLSALRRVAEAKPFAVTLFGACLSVLHLFAAASLRRGWTRTAV